VVLVTFEGDLGNCLIGLGEQIDEAGVAAGHLICPWFVSDDAEFAGGTAVPVDPGVPSLDEVFHGEDPGVLPPQHVVFDQVIDAGRMR
jgi:hypothetical protein